MDQISPLTKDSLIKEGREEAQEAPWDGREEQWLYSWHVHERGSKESPKGGETVPIKVPDVKEQQENLVVDNDGIDSAEYKVDDESDELEDVCTYFQRKTKNKKSEINRRLEKRN